MNAHGVTKLSKVYEARGTHIAREDC